MAYAATPAVTVYSAYSAYPSYGVYSSISEATAYTPTYDTPEAAAPTPYGEVIDGLSLSFVNVDGAWQTMVDAAEWFEYTYDGLNPTPTVPQGELALTYTAYDFIYAKSGRSSGWSITTPLTIAGTGVNGAGFIGGIFPSGTPEQTTIWMNQMMQDAGTSAVGTDGGTSNPLVAPIAGTLVGIFALCAIATGVVCYKRRKAFRREGRGRKRLDDPAPEYEKDHPDGTAQNEGMDVTPLPPPLTRYSRVPPLPGLTSGQRTPRSFRSSVAASSAWADDSELDAIATDGSSYARTLSSYSISSVQSDQTATTDHANPFDHPAYTLMPARRLAMQSQGRTLTPTPVSTSAETANLDPFADPLSPASPLDPTATHTSSGSAFSPAATSAPGTASAYGLGSATSSDDTIISPISTLSPAVLRPPNSHMDDLFSHSSPKLAHTTFIHHVDAGRASLARPTAAEPERLGRGEVHIPPTYMEMYPRPS